MSVGNTFDEIMLKEKSKIFKRISFSISVEFEVYPTTDSTRRTMMEVSI